MATERFHADGGHPHGRKGRALRIFVFGVVQGVGFRPFIHRLAGKHGFAGWVKNAASGVEIHLESRKARDFRPFLEALEDEKPPLARIEKIRTGAADHAGYGGFEIRKSRGGKRFVFISPDIATCAECLEEIRTPGERRYQYPFTNCTNCGPRYTIVKSLPYDRKQTTMAAFPMCPDCAREYADPLDRRYHAQPIACPVCGPKVSLHEATTGKRLRGGVPEAAALIRRGKILAVKGIGGFHLMCDARNVRTVRRLRKIKSRRFKPLALMASGLETVEEYAEAGPAEKEALLSVHRPIVLLRKKKDIPEIAPHLDEMGFMLPYAPLHALLMKDLDLVVATSSNSKDAPIMKDAGEGIKDLCDYVLTHNRPIHMRADDSVLKIAGNRPLFGRRARGFVPYPQRVPEELKCRKSVLALGGELKDTISIYKNGYIVTSQFLGDLDEYRNMQYFKETLSHLLHLFDVKPDVVVTDLHPRFLTTRHAAGLGIPHLRVQHHFAHVLAPLLEHQAPPGRKVLGIALDGFGYGEDGMAWGGEFLSADYESCTRFAHFKSVPLPGGDLASRQPWRMAAAYLNDVFGKRFPDVEAMRQVPAEKLLAVRRMIETGRNSPLTSSCGRLFDAVSFLMGIAPLEMEFEAEAAMRLESLATEPARAGYGYSILGDRPPFIISFAPLIRGLLDDLRKGTSIPRLASKFHDTLAGLIVDVSGKARRLEGTDTVVLAGGVFLNKRLLEEASRRLEKERFRVLRPVNYSPNDESLSVGQTAFALARLRRKGL